MKTLQSIQEETRKEFEERFNGILTNYIPEGGKISSETAILLFNLKSFISEREKIAYEAGMKQTREELVEEGREMKYVIRINCPCYDDIEVEATNEKEAIAQAVAEFSCPGDGAEFCEVLKDEYK